MTQTAIDEAFGTESEAPYEVTLERVRANILPPPVGMNEGTCVLRGAIHQAIGYMVARGGCDSMVLSLVHELNKHTRLCR